MTSKQVDLSHFVACTVHYLQTHEFIAKSKAQPGEEPTATAVWRLYFGRGSAPAGGWDHSKEVREQTGAIVGWARDYSGPNDYRSTLSRIVRQGSVTKRTAGYGASMVSSFERDRVRSIDRSTERAAEAERHADSEYLGSPKERIRDLELTCVFTYDFSGKWGVTRLTKFEDASGNVLVWFSSGDQLEKDNRYSCTFTVTKHEEREGVKQTIINRVASVLLTVPEPDPTLTPEVEATMERETEVTDDFYSTKHFTPEPTRLSISYGSTEVASVPGPSEPRAQRDFDEQKADEGPSLAADLLDILEG